ncbi:MAG: hypothetical protein GC146_06770 [Limimaricola sp.]|nr:hypothetical protein [Limimaricola sp.]
MEERFWTSGADNAQASSVIGGLTIFPYPPGILQGDAAAGRLPKRTGWRSVVLDERQILRSGNLAVLAYRVSAEKSGVPFYKAHCTSTYLHDDGSWIRLSHQQNA